MGTRVSASRSEANQTACLAVLLTMSCPALGADLRIDPMGVAARGQLTHVLCEHFGGGKARDRGPVLIEGVSCPLGGGACERRALMNINGRIVSFPRTPSAAPGKAGSFETDYHFGDMSLQVLFGAAKTSGATANIRDATLPSRLILMDAAATVELAANANCNSD